MPAIRISGLGLVSSYGIGVERAVQGLREGRPGITPLTLFSLPFQDQMQVNQFDHSAFPSGEASAPAILETAVREALAKAEMNAEKLRAAALVVGTGGYLFTAEAEYRLRYKPDQSVPTPALRGPGHFARRVAEDLGIEGPVFTLSTACSSSANALLVASDLIRRGEVTRALVLGIEGLSAVALTGFHSLMLLDPQGSRPFDAQRRGMQLGEAAGAVLLEATDAVTPGGDYLLGGANLCDIHHVTSATPDGSAMRMVMEMALADAGLPPQSIVLVKAHGTGSLDNDLAEAAAMRALFGDAVPDFTGIKRYLGHTLGACGAVEMAALLGCLRAGFIPPTAGFSEPDAALRITPLTDFRPATGGPVMLNTFGFGGNYASLVIAHA
jgi:3-oxoacyl-[acyl-carrier-protein] synthase-1